MASGIMLSAVVPSELKVELDRVAESTGRTRSETIRLALCVGLPIVERQHGLVRDAAIVKMKEDRNDS